MSETNKSSSRRFRPYPEYKDSGVEWLGKIPAHWRSTRLRFVTRINPSKSEVRSLAGGTPVSFVPMEAMGEYGGLDLGTSKPLDTVGNGYTYFRDGDVLVAKITPCFENAKGALAARLEGGIGFGTTELHVLRPRRELDKLFLFYLTLSHHFRSIGASEMYGAGGQKRVPEAFIQNLRHPIPELTEQHAIVAFLERETGKIDALVAKKERLIELLQEKRTALITRVVTKGLNPNVPMNNSRVKWLGEIPAHWRIFHLRRVIWKFVDYRGKTPEKTPSGVPLVTARNIKNQRIDFSLSEEFIPEDLCTQWMVRGLPERGDVLVTTEAPLGESAQIDDTNIALAQRIILLKADKAKITNDYLKYHFAGDSGRSELWSNATGSTALGIKASHLKATLVPVPPVSEQENITTYVDGETVKLDAMILKVRHAVERLKEYRSALISAAVTGKIDVREEGV